MHEEAGNAVAEVVTGEAVVLEVPCARFPGRLLALALDLLIQVILLFALFMIVGLAVNNGAASATAGAIALTVTIAIVVGYPVLWETLTRGGTPGKFALGLRVVSDAGGPGRGSSAQGSPASGGTGPTGPRRGGESPRERGLPGLRRHVGRRPGQQGKGRRSTYLPRAARANSFRRPDPPDHSRARRGGL